MEKRNINLKELGRKARSKYELYQLLTIELKLYLPPYKYCTTDFIADVLDGFKQALNYEDVAVRKVPQIKKLRTSDLVKFCIEECNGENYLPRNIDKKLPEREWLCNLCNSLNQAEFSNLIDEALMEREEKFLSQNRILHEVPNHIADAIESSRLISRSHGRSNLLLNRTKRFERVERESKEKEERKESEVLLEQMQNEILSLKDELERQRILNNDADKNRKMLARLFENNVIDENGNLH